MYSHSQYSYYQGYGNSNANNRNSHRNNGASSHSGSYVGFNSTNSTSASRSSGNSMQQGEVTWNGSQWTPTAAAPALKSAPSSVLFTSSSTAIPPPDTPLPPTPPPLTKVDTSLMTIQELVTHFSSVYHCYSQQVQDHKKTMAQHHANMQDTSKLEGCLQWAEYYSDLSARAAHYYNNLAEQIKSDGTEQNQSHGAGWSNSVQESKTHDAGTLQKNKHEEPSPEDIKNVPESFRRYAHENLSKCSTETQRRGMQELLELTIRRALQGGYMSTKDWNREPFLTAPALVTDASKPAQSKTSATHRGDGDGGRGNGEGAQKMNSNTSNSSYVPPSPSSSSFSSFSRSSTAFHDSHRQQQQQHYHDTSPSRPSSSSSRFQSNSSYNHQANDDIYDENYTNDTNGAVNEEITKDVKKIDAMKEQKSTLDDWYGENENASASITFEPKQVSKKKKKKRHKKKETMMRNNVITNDGRSSFGSSETSNRIILDQQQRDQQHQSSFGNADTYNATMTDNPHRQQQEKPPPPSFSDTAYPQYQDEHKQNEKLFVLDPYGDTAQHAGQDQKPMGTMNEESNRKRKLELEQQKATLSDWYGGEETEAASIQFVPKPKLSKREKKKKRMESWKKKVSQRDAILSTQNSSVSNILPHVEEESEGPASNNADEEASSDLITFIHKNSSTSKKGKSKVEKKAEIAKAQSKVLNLKNEEDIIMLPKVQGKSKVEKKAEIAKAQSKVRQVKEEENVIMLPSVQSPKKENIATLPKNVKLRRDESSNFDSSKDVLAHRANRFSGHGGITSANSSKIHDAYSQGIERYMGKSVIGGKKTKLDESDYAKMTVKGICKKLEKSYLRLTAPPRAELVRPQKVLQKHLKNLKAEWIKYVNQRNMLNKTNTRDYTWFCSQLKAIRQDLQVQRIVNDFTVDVYETHARLALQEGDLNEFNQSQTQLKELYEVLSHRALAKGKRVIGLSNENEFIAYRIIYHVFLTGNKKYEGGSSDLLNIMINLTAAQRKDSAIDHALKVRLAIAEQDYHAFFRLQDNSPNLGCFLMDMMVSQVRAVAMKFIVKAYRPSISLPFVLKELGYSIDEQDIKDGKVWLEKCGCKFSADESLIMTKETVLNGTYLNGNNSSSLI